MDQQQPSNIAPPGTLLDWNCRALIDTVSSTQMKTYHTVRIHCVIVSQLSEGPVDFRNWILVLETPPPGYPHPWTILTFISNVASGSVDDGTTFRQIVRAQAAKDAGIHFRDIDSMRLIGVFDSDLGDDEPTLDVVVLVRIPVDEQAMQEDLHWRPIVRWWFKSTVE